MKQRASVRYDEDKKVWLAFIDGIPCVKDKTPRTWDHAQEAIAWLLMEAGASSVTLDNNAYKKKKKNYKYYWPGVSIVPLFD